MSSIVRNIVRSSTVRSLLSSTQTINVSANQLSRSLWSLSTRQPIVTSISSDRSHRTNQLCSCGCGNLRHSHTKAEKELVNFLAEEIVAEKKTQKLKTIPTELDGFKVSLNGANITLEKEQKTEKIKITFNINHTVDAESEPDVNPNAEEVDLGEMKSKPDFHVEIIRGNQTLAFVCSFNGEEDGAGDDSNYNDIFVIDELALLEGTDTENAYSVSGEVLDGYLYDLLMNYLEEKGISNDFAEKLIELSTSYEHSAYVSLLEGLSKFTSGK